MKLVFLMLILLVSTQPAGADEWHFDDVDRIVAISDIHGAYGAMLETLQSAAVIDDTLTWVAASTHLVIVGDVLDRGPDSRQVMDFLMRLEEEAAAAGGRVHVLIGNHEAMNISGDLRYVATAEYAAFADDETPEEREQWFSEYQVKRAEPGRDEQTVRDDFERRFPSGYFAHRRAFAPDGQYGRWLLTKPVIVVINGTAFVHGGLSPMVTELGLQGINGTLVDELETYVRAVQKLIDKGVLLPTDSDGQHAKILRALPRPDVGHAEVAGAVADVLRLSESRLQDTDGPLWYRQNAYCGELIESDRLDESLAAIGARRVVIGHTPTAGRRVYERFSGRIYEIDTGMLANYYKGRGNALIIEPQRVYAIQQGSTEAIPPTPHPRLVGRRPAAPMLAEDIEVLLQSGEMIARSTDQSDRVILAVSEGGYTVEAEFIKPAHGRSEIYADVAAYQLDRLLQLDMVPVTVKRAFDGEEGSLQFVPSDWIDEQQRQIEKSGGGADCSLNDQWNAMLVFDILMGNEYRTADAIRYDASSFQLLLVGHNGAFPTSGSKPSRYRDLPLKVGPAWKAALGALSDEVLQEKFADTLDKRRIKALAKRRDVLLSE